MLFPRLAEWLKYWSTCLAMCGPEIKSQYHNAALDYRNLILQNQYLDITIQYPIRPQNKENVINFLHL
jgi:hypothetical protein